jgi:hypothetical protein
LKTPARTESSRGSSDETLTTSSEGFAKLSKSVSTSGKRETNLKWIKMNF